MVDMNKKNRGSWKIILSGSGGQGIITLSRVLAHAGISARLNVSFLPAYGAEMRGGYVYSMISLSTQELISPVISQADIGVFMDENSLKMLKQYLKNSAWLLWNSSLIKPDGQIKNYAIGIPASEVAEKIGSVKIANMVMLGGLLRILEETGFPGKEKDIAYGVKEIIKEQKNINLNMLAISEGKRIVDEVIRNG
jgi:2-oxoglutarate ferredoxin oxidoreductase subunit gamma